MEGRGCPIALLDASAAGQPLYAGLGFVEDDQVVAFLREETAPLPPAPVPPVAPVRDGDLTALAAFDTPVFGASRAHVLASYLADHCGRAVLTRDAQGAITGYLIAQAHTLGPWAARTSEAAAALLAHALALPFETAPQVLAPAANRDAPALLARYSFRAQRTLSHMRLGNSRSPARRDLIYGQTSFALG